MKLIGNNQRRPLSRAAAFLLLATPAFALFGVGDLVFDPSVYAEAIAQVQQAIQMVQTAQSTLTTIQANLQNFTWKSLWRTAQSTLPADSVQNRYGETAGWDTALNTNSPAAAATAWNRANVQVSPGTYLAGQTPGNSAPLSALAMIEAFDSSSPNCLNAVAQYRALRTANATAQNALETDQLDTTAATNTEIEQLNLLNASDAQQMHEWQSQGVLHACLAEQTTISNMAQRNAAAAAINDAAFIQQQRAANNVMPANESNTWQTYIP